MNLQVGPKPYTLVESLEIPLKGPLKEALWLPMNLQVHFRAEKIPGDTGGVR